MRSKSTTSWIAHIYSTHESHLRLRAVELEQPVLSRLAADAAVSAVAVAIPESPRTVPVGAALAHLERSSLVDDGAEARDELEGNECRADPDWTGWHRGCGIDGEVERGRERP